jgi:hypothetical protein
MFSVQFSLYFMMKKLTVSCVISEEKNMHEAYAEDRVRT